MELPQLSMLAYLVDSQSSRLPLVIIAFIGLAICTFVCSIVWKQIIEGDEMPI